MGQKARTQHKQKEAERNIHKTNTEQTKKSQCTSDILNEEVMIMTYRHCKTKLGYVHFW